MDKYNLTARVYPMVLFYLPLAVLAILPFYEFKNYFHYSIPAVVFGLLFYLSSHLVRDSGKKKEKKLWNYWGGSPTTQLFRWKNDVIDIHTKSRYHKKMHLLCPVDITVDANYEENNFELSDEVYKSWSRFIIAGTRNTTILLFYSQKILRTDFVETYGVLKLTR